MNNDDTLKLLVKGHIKAALAKERVQVPHVHLSALKQSVEVILDPRMAREKVRWLACQEGYLAFEYEATGLKPDAKEQHLFCVSFCLNGKGTFVVPVDEKLYPSLRQVLVNPKLKKIGSNIKFEQRWRRAKLGVDVQGNFWDTMLAAHCLDNRPDITSVKFQAFVHFGIGDYSSSMKQYLEAKTSNSINRIHEAPIDDLYRYCGCDSLLEYMVAMKQRELMGLKGEEK
jgi:DNA polymerase I-like protein with 3'-5' exonuclease and polymerase domains